MVEYRDALYKHSLTKSVHDARRKIHREVAEGMRHPAASNRRADPLGRGAVEIMLVPPHRSRGLHVLQSVGYEASGRLRTSCWLVRD